MSEKLHREKIEPEQICAIDKRNYGINIIALRVMTFMITNDFINNRG